MYDIVKLKEEWPIRNKPREFSRLRQVREDRDYTQKEIAEYLNMHTTQYQRYERGESTVPADIIVALAKLYEVPSDYLLELSDDDCFLRHKKTITQ